MFSGGWARFAELTLSRLLFGGFGIQLPLLTGGRLKANIEETRLGLEKTRATRGTCPSDRPAGHRVAWRLGYNS